MERRYIILNTLLILFIIAVFGYLGRHWLQDQWESLTAEPLPEAVSYNQLHNTNAIANIENPATNVNVQTNTEPVVVEPTPLPETFNLDVPFTQQSPFAEWTEQDNESCEEAAALMVHYYWQDKTFTKQLAKDELQTIVDFENEHFGYYKDTTAAETAEFIKELWGYERVDVRDDVTIENIKREVAAGRPVILPTAGRMLGNPNFRAPGPIYHMLVVRGWTKDAIITNDPGTRKGEQYVYDPDVLWNAIHDWNGGDVENGEKLMIVVYPNT